MDLQVESPVPSIEEADAERVQGQRLDLALRAGRLGLWDLDLRTGRAWRTPEHDRLFGYPRLLPSWTVEDARRHVVPEDLHLFDQAFEAAMVSGRFHYLLRIRPPGADLRWLEAQGEVLRDAAGMPRRMLGVVSDVTARQEAEAAVVEHRNRLALFIRHAPAAIAMLDRELRYLAASQRYLTDYRLGDQEVVGKSHYQLFPEIPERWKAIHRRCLQGAVERCEQEPFPRADGRTDWVRWEIRPWRDAAGAVGGLIIFSEVITVQKELEAQAAMASRLQAVATLVRGTAHEINNPLALVVSNLEYLQERLAPGAPPTRPAELRDALTDAQAGAQRIRDIVKALSTFVQAPGSVRGRAEVAVAVRRARETARRELARCAEVVVDLPALPPVGLPEEGLALLLSNLLCNAGQATGPHPNRVRVEARPAPEGRVQLVVRDTGVGMPPEVLAHVFEPFFTTRPVGRGQGLGIPQCRGLVDAVGGTLSFQSEPGQGTTVVVELPVATT